jgi:hypothetical protein
MTIWHIILDDTRELPGLTDKIAKREVFKVIYKSISIYM